MACAVTAAPRFGVNSPLSRGKECPRNICWNRLVFRELSLRHSVRLLQGGLIPRPKRGRKQINLCLKKDVTNPWGKNNSVHHLRLSLFRGDRGGHCDFLRRGFACGCEPKCVVGNWIAIMLSAGESFSIVLFFLFK